MACSDDQTRLVGSPGSVRITREGMQNFVPGDPRLPPLAADLAARAAQRRRDPSRCRGVMRLWSPPPGRLARFQAEPVGRAAHQIFSSSGATAIDFGRGPEARPPGRCPPEPAEQCQPKASVPDCPVLTGLPHGVARASAGVAVPSAVVPREGGPPAPCRAASGASAYSPTMTPGRSTSPAWPAGTNKKRRRGDPRRLQPNSQCLRAYL